MIVPVILDYNLLSKDKTDGLWVFYKYLEFARKNNSCIIGREIYFEDPNNFKDNWALRKDIMETYDYPSPDVDFLKYNEQFMIEDSIFYTENVDWEYLLVNSNEKLEKEIMNRIQKIENLKGEKVDMIITWFPFLSLKKICDKMGIKLLFTELTSIRGEWYNCSLGTLSRHIKYEALKDFSLFSLFNLDKDQLILSREELIILFSYKQDVARNLKLLKSQPVYEVGYVIGLQNDPYEKAYCSIQQQEIMNQLISEYHENELLFRPHPQSPLKLNNGKYNIDHSCNCREFISLCDKLVVNISNVGYEGMLYGRKISHLNAHFISSFGHESKLSNLNDSVIDLEHLNFLTFYLYTPFDLLFDKEYLYDFYNDKYSVDDIYIRNLSKVLLEHGINYKEYKQLSRKKRIAVLLKKLHHFSQKQISNIYNLYYTGVEHTDIYQLNKDLEYKNEECRELLHQCEINSEKQKELIEHLEDKNQEIVSLRRNLEDLKSSTSWKITVPFRFVSGKIKNMIYRNNIRKKG